MSSGSSSGRPDDATGTETPASSVEAAKRPEDKKAAAPCTEFDNAYFRYYANVGVHEDMIKDGVRTGTYRDAIMHHQKYIAGKVVVDVGCGTGILSIFCAEAGAKRVYAVEASDIAVQAKEVVKANNLADKIIVLHGRVEDVEIDEEVDVIISEWMGHMLLFESMLESVITARDRWLKPGGLILPSHASLDIAPITNPNKYRNRVDFWRDVYAIDMSAMMPLAKECAFEEPLVERIEPENLISWSDVIIDVDCYKVKLQELEPRPAKFKFSSKMRAPLHGFAFWFDVQFRGPKTVSSNCNSSDLPENEPPVLSTDPEKPQTHWQQTLIYLKDPLEVKLDQVIEGSVTLSRNKENHRFMNVRIEYTTGGHSFVRESVMRCSTQEALLVRK